VSERWVTGDRSGLSFPADPAALRDGDTAFLTKAFHASGVLAQDNSVLRIDRCEDVAGGSTGRKMLLDVTYCNPAPNLHTDLFVKFSRDFDNPVRDHGRTQMESEVRFASLSTLPEFPIAVPHAQFADFHRDSGTGILISQRIQFGANGIEPQHHKCLDYELSRPVEHYRALFTALARLAGAHRSGRLPELLTAEFPVNLQAAAVGEPPPLTHDRLRRRLSRLAEFTATHPGLLPDNVRSPEFLARLVEEAPQVMDREEAIWRHLSGARDYIALSHWNANIDNAWFWTDADGELRCGLMDWGCVSQLNVAMAIWGAMSGAETSMWDNHFDDFVELFCTELHACGGPDIDPAELERQVVLYVMLMGITWLLDVPALIHAKAPEATQRTDPSITGDEGVRAPLQMLTNVLNLWEKSEVTAALHGL
jgi:hypothetical protein